MPAEWEPHEATWLAWPHYRGDWPGKFETIPWVYTEIIRNLARHERVELIVTDAASGRQARKLLDRANAPLRNIRFHRWPTDRGWMRDSGCIFVDAETGFAPHNNREGHEFTRATKGQKKRGASAPGGDLVAINFRFNAWAKYSNWRHDDKIGELMSSATHSQAIRPLHRGSRVVLEGGSIDVNGCGALLTTEECLLSKIQQRNPGMLRKDYEKAFAQYLGALHVIWLGKGISGDDTHGHVDDLARFVAADTIVTVVEANRKDVNHKPLRENLRRLHAARDRVGKPLNIVEMPMPAPVVFEKRRLPASYANFYIANGIVLVPVFNDPNDRIALDTLSAVFPTREIVPIYCGDLVWGLGTVHCMTQQQPARKQLSAVGSQPSA
ncbi:MAG TPA: agmatine deiminase family protein [Candidatus Eremiobacteraceae bacterium]|nr:agmatine deiminase family protein [Candidatus Eremiobacteraceae bacterium]